MKKLITLLFTGIALSSFAQSSYKTSYFNKLTDIEGTEFVVATVENYTKLHDSNNRNLLFINTKNGTTTQVDFPKDAYIGSIQQIKLDSLQINLLLLSTRMNDLDGKNGVDWNDPTQLIILSTDGLSKTSLTDEKFYTKNWTVNKHTGSLVISGYYDSNNNRKYDANDTNETSIYDLKTLKLISKF